MNLWTIYQEAIKLLENNNQNPKIALWIFEKYFPNNKDLNLLLFNNRNTNFDDYKNYLKDVNDYINGKPLARIIKKVNFYNLELFVDKKVFCPRTETELLVEHALSWLEKNPNANIVCDIGVGTGAICLGVNKNNSKTVVYGNDINYYAILNCYKNSIHNDCKVSLLMGSNLEPYIKNDIKVNCLIANPPYIDWNETLDNGVKENDPLIALFADDNGLKSYQEIIENAHKVLIKPYIILFEISHNQVNDIINLLVSNNYDIDKIEVLNDYNNKQRIIKVVSHV